MRRFFLLAVIVFAVVLMVALVGPSMPDGSPLRAAGDALREMGRFMARGFGGGYGELSP